MGKGFIISLESLYFAETFTVWMKSLIMQANGLTVFNSNGQIVYRIDNYNDNTKAQVFLTDLSGKLLFRIRRKRSWFGCYWEGFEDDGENREKIKALFGVKRVKRFFSRKLRCDVKLLAKTSLAQTSFRLEGFKGKTPFRILDFDGGLVAEAKRKQSSTGVQLGEDVLNLVLMKPHLNPSLIMALLTVYQLIQHKM